MDIDLNVHIFYAVSTTLNSEFSLAVLFTFATINKVVQKLTAMIRYKHKKCSR